MDITVWIVITLWVLIKPGGSSQPIVFTENSPWTHGSIYRSGGTCTYQLLRPYSPEEWKITVTTDKLTDNINIWNWNIRQKVGHSYLLDNIYSIGPGNTEVTFQFDQTQPDELTGYCQSNTEPIETTSTTFRTNGESLADSTTESSDLTITTATSVLNWKTTEQAEVKISPTSTLFSQFVTDNMQTCYQPTQNCHIVCNESITYIQAKQRAAFLVEDLKIDKKATSKAKRMKICAQDNRPTAVVIGTAGILMLCFAVGIIIFCDLPIFIRYFVDFKRFYYRYTCIRKTTGFHDY